MEKFKWFIFFFAIKSLYLVSELLHGSHSPPCHDHTVGRFDNFLKLFVPRHLKSYMYVVVT